MSDIDRRTPVSSTSAAALRIARDILLQLWDGRQKELDPLDALVFSTVIQANVDPATAALEDQLAFASLDQPPPDVLRRPATVNGLAESLNLPFETVRRRLKLLASRGLIEFGSRGIIVPEPYFHTDTNRAIVLAMDQTAGEGFRRLLAAGFFDEHPLPLAGPSVQGHPHRVIARLITGYALRLAQELRDLCGDYLNTLLIMHMTRLNTAHLDDQRAQPTIEGETTLIADEVKAHASIQAIARASGIPFETTRRRLHRLEEGGHCTASESGYFVAAEAFGAVAGDLAAANDMNLWRLYRTCALAGAVEGWLGRPGQAAQPAKDPGA